METMIERVARAIIGPYLPVPPGSKFTLEQLRDVRWERIISEAEKMHALMAARAAIAAMRDPTDAMIDAGNWERENGYNVTEVHEAMIDAALSGPTP